MAGCVLVCAALHPDSTDFEPLPPREATIESVIDVTMKMIADQVVALGKYGGCAARAKCRLAAHAAERSGNVAALAALQQHDNDEKQTDNDVNGSDQNNHA